MKYLLILFTCLSFGQFNPIFFGTKNIVYEAEYTALLNRAITLGYTLPSMNQRMLDNKKIKNLKAEGIWDELDLLYVCNRDISEKDFAKLNWKNPSSFELNQSNGALVPDFSSGNGFYSMNDGKYFFTGYQHQTHFSKMLHADCSIIMSTFNIDATFSTPAQLFGSRVADDGTQFTINNGTSALFRARLFTTTSDLSVTQSNMNSHFHSLRIGTGAGAIKLYRNGTLVGSVAQSSAELNNNLNFAFLGINLNGTITATGNRGIKYLSIGSNLESKQNTFYLIMNNLY